ncbi:Gfo/Idh/MocA family oxidoreductase [Methylobacterium sp. PvR107]|uniref:Gfo/Idh/MocA family oxidoreductase n=1 Tax=Methylobacterium sp. PvR107 TaxID=2806597 RepID=UPI001B4CA7CC|nr:Gfo/Idh/MocA family oxidoreductase [Methylobacterium sp. PvR107]MBP1183930.1 putative dehydrogenase [Methylobacterium sp. PvR107]
MTGFSAAAPIRVGLIGYGYAGRTFHAPLIGSAPGLALRRIASRDPARVAADLPDVTVVADPIAVATADAVDLVVIATPNDTHAPLAQAALWRRASTS